MNFGAVVITYRAILTVSTFGVFKTLTATALAIAIARADIPATCRSIEETLPTFFFIQLT